MGLFDFYFQAALQTAKRKRIATLVIIHPQTMIIMIVAMKMVMKTIMIVVIAIVMSMKVVRMMNAMTIIAVGSYLLKMDFSHYYIIRL